MRGKPKDGSKNPGGRPKKYSIPVKAETIEGKIEEMASYSLSQEEIASILGYERQVFYDNQCYLAAFKRGEKHCNASLKRRQYLEAMNGNTTMLVWLGKQRLGQKDKSEIGGPDGKPIALTVEQAQQSLAAFLASFGKHSEQPEERVQ